MRNIALIVIDVQKAIDDPSWGEDRNNPDCEANIARLLAFFRQRQRPIFHVRHLSRDPQSTYRPGQPLAGFKDEVAPLPGERIIDKSTNSAFIGTTLERELRDAAIGSVVITGVITNNSVEATARMAGNLGFDTIVVRDATATFGRRDYDGHWRTAAEVHAMSLANLDREYAWITSTDDLLAGLIADRFFHGTKADLKPGDLIAPGYSSNYGKGKQAAYVYLTATLDAATWGAELAAGEGRGRIYIVEPTGPIEDDPNLTDKKYPGNPTKSYRTKEPLRVTGEIEHWEGHPPERVQAMRDAVERLRRQGIEAIED